MARKFLKKKKNKYITHMISSDCMMEFITDAASSRRVESGRFVSRSQIINEIVREKMNELGWDCN